MDAGIGLEAARNWWGRSLWDYEISKVCINSIKGPTYEIDLGLSALLDAEDKRLFQARCRVSQGEEGLVWPLGRLPIRGGEHEFQRIAFAQ